jgi:hypothetical protein
VLFSGRVLGRRLLRAVALTPVVVILIPSVAAPFEIGSVEDDAHDTAADVSKRP